MADKPVAQKGDLFEVGSDTVVDQDITTGKWKVYKKDGKGRYVPIGAPFDLSEAAIAHAQTIAA